LIDLDDSMPSLPAISPPGRTLRAASFAVSGVIALMILLPVAQVFVRRFGGDISGASVLCQHLTLWVGFIGALLATISGKNISLSTVHLLPKGRPQLYAHVFSGAVTATVAGLLSYGSVMMIIDNFAQPSALPLKIPLWASEMVMPVTLALIALRSVWKAHGGWGGRVITLLALAGGFLLGWKMPEAHLHAILIPGVILMTIAFLLGTPVYATMAGLAMLLYFADGTPIPSVPNTAYGLVTNATLPAVPLLTIAGYVLAAGGASKRIVTLYRALLGWMPGGMGLMALFVCAVFTALTGASGVTILAVGGVILPSLLEEKYPEGFSLGLVTAAGSLGLLFPPSTPVLLYSIKAEVDLGHLFLAGAVPGVLIILMVGIYTIVVGVKAKAPRHPFVPSEAARALWAAKWDLGLPVVMVAALALSLATLVEAAAIGALYAILVEVAIFRNLHPTKDLPKVMASGATLVGSVVVLMGVALALSEYLTLQDVPSTLLDWIQAHIHSTWGFLLALNLMLLVLGSVLEMYSAIILIAPLIVPLGKPYGITATHLGVVFLANLELGFLLPPLGLNLFLSGTRFGKPLPKIYKNALPFLIIMTLGVLVVTYFPSLTTGVLSLFGIKNFK
jgi:tripartite ATP-independent transporter DctM subunit